MVTVEEAVAARDLARSEAEEALVEWRSAQGEELRDFLIAEAKVTAKMQHEVTLKLGTDAPGFKAQTTQAADSAASALMKWASSLTLDQILAMPGSLREALQREVTEVAIPWADLFRRAGFDPGGLPGYDYHTLHEARPWHFYNPETGTARSTRIPTGVAFRKLGDTLDRYRNSLSDLKAAERARDVRAAEDLWGD